MARASAFQAEGHGFESRFPLQKDDFSVAHVAQLVEHFLGKEEVHRFKPGRGLHLAPEIGISARDGLEPQLTPCRRNRHGEEEI